MAYPILLSFPFRSDSIYRTISPTLMYPIPPSYPISSIDGKHGATAGMGVMFIVWNS